MTAIAKTHVALVTLCRREIHRFMRMANQTVLPPLLTALMYILVFGVSIGSRVGDIEGFTYMQFILPGLVMMGIIMASYMNVVSSLYLAKFQGNIQEILVSPISYKEMVAGFLAGGVARATVVAAGIIVLSLIFGDLSLRHPFIVIYFALMTAILFSAFGYISALWAKSFDQMNLFSTFILQPLIYLGGVFYSIDMLPPTFQAISQLNPLLYIINGFRYGFLGLSDTSVLGAALFVTILSVVMVVLSIYLTKKGWNLRT